MSGLFTSRRDFLKLAAQTATMLGLGSSAIERTASAMERLASGKTKVLWLQGLSCSGCTISTLNSDVPGALELLTEYLSLVFHNTISTATGKTAAQVVSDCIDAQGYLLVVEGSIPLAMPEACVFAGRPFEEVVERAAKSADAMIAIGTCASYGGIPAAENNPTGAVSLREFATRRRISTPLINLPSCPSHPDWLLGTLVQVTEFGMPELDDELRPRMFYSRIVHDQCPRYSDYERGNFATTFSDDGCLFKLGCLGPRTYSDCIQRRWNGGMSHCISAGAPCIGCAGSDFASRADFPLYRIGEDVLLDPPAMTH